MFSQLYYLPLYFQVAKGYSPLLSGVALIPQSFSVCPASVITGILITRTGRYRWAIWGGWALTVLGTGLLYLLDVDTPTVAWYVEPFLLPFESRECQEHFSILPHAE